ncbi:hypothetical protein [Ottowia massiliensis]|uniref:hypothetical protein n=1 Tax=Ottowia massiliensis TaxID=2045302 RepID=UPI000C823F40|nr:hypothetical protein [Ottowia massiliensis]
MQVFALDEHVRRLRRVAGAGQQGVAGGLLDFAAGGGLARPAQFVMFLRGGRIGLVRLQQLLQAADVDLPVADDFRRGLPQQRREGAGALFQRIGAEARRGACVRLLAVGCWLLAVGCWLLAVGCWLLAVGCWLLAVGCWLLAVGCWLFIL